MVKSKFSPPLLAGRVCACVCALEVGLDEERLLMQLYATGRKLTLVLVVAFNLYTYFAGSSFETKTFICIK